jgi:glycosyltransferase involved in cell wall biosynthesis
VGAVRVGIVTKHLGLPVGFGTYATRLLAALGEIDGETSYFVYTPRAAAPVGLGRNFTNRTFPVLPGLRSGLTVWEHALVPQAARRDGVDLLHYLHTASPLGRVRMPVVTNVLDTIAWSVPGYAQPWPYQSLAARAIRRADRVVTISESAKRNIADLFDVDAERVTVTPLAGPAVDEVPVRKLPYLLFVGGSERRKNLRTMLGAFASGDFPGIRLVVVGPYEPSPVNDDPEELMRPLSAEQRGRVEWRGHVQADVLEQLYRQASALVFPSLHEGFGLPVVEAMARLTPVICSNRSSLPEVAKDGALLVDPLDAAALEHAVKAVLSDASLRDRLVARGREVAVGYRWDETARRTRAVYDELLGRGKGPAADG